MIKVVKSRTTDRDLGLKALIGELERAKHASVEAGLFEGETGSVGGLTIAQYGAVNEFGGGHVPERSFIRRTHDENRSKYADFLDKAYDKILRGKAKVIPSLTALGERVASDIRRTITAVRTPPNAPATISKKRSSNPLIDTGAMRNWVRSRVLIGRFRI